MRTLAQSDASKRSRKRHTEKVNPQIAALAGDGMSPNRRGSDGSNSNSPRNRRSMGTMSPDAFKKKYSKDGTLPDGGLGSMISQASGLAGNRSRFGQGDDQVFEVSGDEEDSGKVIPQVVNVKNSNKDEEGDWEV